jgi:long-subunit fatty acid transport protein
MRKLLTTVFAALVAGSLFAGGLVTNTNQSAAWVRLPARNASVNADAAYFNPAGLMKLENGFHFSLSNQTIFQTKKVENFYKGPGNLYGLNDGYYEGDVKAPAFPSVYAVYKMDRLAFSFGFNPIGGGGGAEYLRGLPSFEMSPSDLVPSLAATDLDPITAGVQGAKQYRLDAYLEGTSVFFGLQGGVSFKVNEWLSVAAGLRYVMAKNTYNGHLTDIQVNIGTTTAPVWLRADDIMTGIAAQAKGGGDGLQPLITGGLGGMTASAAATAGYITTAQATQIVGGLTQLGVPNASALTISQSQTAYYGAQAKYNANATLLDDQYVDVTQTGSGFTPIFSVNISPTENLNIGIKYEMRTKMQLENKTVSDFMTGYTVAGTPITMFPDGDLTPADMPGMISVGLDYKIADNVKLSLGSNYFFDKKADYGHKADLDLNSSTPSTFIPNSDIIDKNGMSLQAGAEVNLSEKLLVSGGYVWANQGVNEKYQSDLTYGLATHTFGFGGAYKIMPNLLLNVGFGYTAYVDDEQLVDHVFSANGTVYNPRETYGKNAMIVAVGVDFNF